MEIMYPLSLIVERPMWQVLILTIMIYPGIPFILEGLQAGRLVPISRDKQFYAFWPGNFFLAFCITLSSRGLEHPSGVGWWSGVGMHAVVLVGSFGLYIWLNMLDLSSKYKKAQLRSWFKMYHNSLYFWYAYLAVMVFIGLLSSTLPWWYKAVATAPGIVWIACLIADRLQPPEITANRMRHAHSPVQAS